MTDTPSLYHQAEALLAQLGSGGGDEPFDIDYFVHRLLAKYGRIAILWGIEDVQGERPDLTDEDAWETLLEVKDKHDADWGVSYATLREIAAELFPARKTSQPEED